MLPDVVDTDCNHIVTFMQIIRYVIDKSRITTPMCSDFFAIYIDICNLENTFKLQLYFFVVPAGRHIKIFAIPAITYIKLGTHRIRNTEVMRKPHINPCRIIIINSFSAFNITADKFPAAVKIDLFPPGIFFCLIRRHFCLLFFRICLPFTGCICCVYLHCNTCRWHKHRCTQCNCESLSPSFFPCFSLHFESSSNACSLLKFRLKT